MCHRQDPLLAPGYMCEACTLLRLLFHFPATVHLERQRRQQLCSTCLPWGSRRVPMQQQREGRRDRRGVMPCKCRSLSAGAWSCHSLHTMWGRVRSLARQGQTWWGNKGHSHVRWSGTRELPLVHHPSASGEQRAKSGRRQRKPRSVLRGEAAASNAWTRQQQPHCVI